MTTKRDESSSLIDNDVAKMRSYLTSVCDGSDGSTDRRRIKSTFSQIMKAVMGGISNISANNEGTSQNNGSENTKMSRKEILRLRREERLKAKKTRNSSIHPSPSSTPTRGDPTPSNRDARSSSYKFQPPKDYEQRCTGTAIEKAIELATSSSRHTGRILLFTNGCPNVGAGSVIAPHLGGVRKPVDRTPLGVGGSSGSTSKGRIQKAKRDVVDPHMMNVALEFFKNLGEDAFESGIGIDVFCSGKIPSRIRFFNSAGKFLFCCNIHLTLFP